MTTFTDPLPPLTRLGFLVNIASEIAAAKIISERGRCSNDAGRKILDQHKMNEVAAEAHALLCELEKRMGIPSP